MRTRQVIELAEQMSEDEDLGVILKLSEVLSLHLNMNNNPLEEVSVSLSLEPIEGIYALAPLRASYGGITTDGVLAMHDIRLSILDVVKLFRLPETVEWEVTDHGTFLL